MSTQIVKPACTKYESFYICLAMLTVISLSGMSILHRGIADKEKVLLDYQLSGYGDLNNLEQGIFNDLYSAALEIDAYHDENEGEWPSIRELEGQFIPPFVHDQVWKKRGELIWTQKTFNKKYLHLAAYMGKTSNFEKAGSFLLIMSHKHGVEGEELIEAPVFHEEQPFKIWHYNFPHTSCLCSQIHWLLGRSLRKDFNLLTLRYYPQHDLSFPDNFTVRNLILKGLKEIIPYKGEEEIKRLKGEIGN